MCERHSRTAGDESGGGGRGARGTGHIPRSIRQAYDGLTPFHMCAENGHLEMARTLIDAKADFDGFSEDSVIDLRRSYTAPLL